MNNHRIPHVKKHKVQKDRMVLANLLNNNNNLSTDF